MDVADRYGPRRLKPSDLGDAIRDSSTLCSLSSVKCFHERATCPTVVSRLNVRLLSLLETVAEEESSLQSQEG